jgi:uncharacterized RDD family membrane protein YckC
MISQPMQNPPAPPPPVPPQMPPPPSMAPYQQPSSGQYTYAGFWIRLVARLLDSLIVGLPLAALFGLIAVAAGVFASSSSNSNQGTQNAAGAVFGGVFVLFYLVALVIGIGYWVYFWGTSGQTFGMRALRLRVVDATTGGPIGIPRALVRWLMTIVNSWACYLGWIWVAFDARKQGWHDKVANSVVLQG